MMDGGRKEGGERIVKKGEGGREGRREREKRGREKVKGEEE